MSALGSLLLQYPQFKGTDLPGMYTSAMNYSTNLLSLQEAQRQREVAAQARAYIAQNPESVLGGGGMPQSTLGALGPAGGGALTQTTTRPPDALMGTPATQTTQTVPGYPDMSRYAGVSPGGGGPLPPGTMGQVMPTVTPPGGMPQPALGGLSPQANPLMQLMQQSPDAAFAVMARQQQLQQAAMNQQLNVL